MTNVLITIKSNLVIIRQASTSGQFPTIGRYDRMWYVMRVLLSECCLNNYFENRTITNIPI